MQPCLISPNSRRASANRANSQLSTGPVTEPGKHRSSMNALRHGLTSGTAILPSEDPAAYENHHRQFLAEYQPATATESQLVKQLADTSWRLNRIPLLEADLLARAANPPTEQAAIDFDIVDAHRLLNNLGIQGQRLARQFQKTIDQLRGIQEDRHFRERRELKDAAAIHELNKYEGVPWEPSDHGFVFTKDQVERFAQRMMRQNQARYIAYDHFEKPYAAIKCNPDIATAHR